MASGAGAVRTEPGVLGVLSRFCLNGHACYVVPESQLANGAAGSRIGAFALNGERFAVCLERRCSRDVVPDPIDVLTSRELEIALLIAAGQGNKEIARRLGISKFTVGAHLARVFAKLAVHSRVALAARLMRRIDVP